MDSEVSGTSSTGTQTDSPGVQMEPREVQTESKEVQTEPVKISPAEDSSTLSENLLTPSSRSLLVSLPLQHFFEKKFNSTSQLSKAMNSLKCLHDWFSLSYDSECSKLKLVRITDKGAMTLEISYDMQWSISISRARVDCSSPQFAVLPTTISSISELQTVLTYVNQRKFCLGIADPQFAPVAAQCKGVFKDRSGK